MGLILGVTNLGVYYDKIGINFGCDKFGINFGCVRFEGVLGSILGVKHFGDVFGKELRLILGLILDVVDLKDPLKLSLGLALGEIYLG